jgi:hypothetical protein
MNAPLITQSTKLRLPSRSTLVLQSRKHPLQIKIRLNPATDPGPGFFMIERKKPSFQHGLADQFGKDYYWLYNRGDFTSFQHPAMA